MVAERAVEVDASCIWRWVQAYAPELNKRCRPHLKPTNRSYRIDETYIRLKGKDKYLYRAIEFHWANDRFPAHGEAGYGGSQTLSAQGYLRVGKCDAQE
jgi:hypothetical protein